MIKPILNIGILAHGDAGKTTITEQILYQSGSQRTIGSVDNQWGHFSYFTKINRVN